MIAWLQLHWQPFLVCVIGVLTVIQEVLALLGHGSGAISAIISFLQQFSAPASAPPASPPPASK
jgi:hypothetical protein